jgi:hypothetical protein
MRKTMRTRGLSGWLAIAIVLAVPGQATSATDSDHDRLEDSKDVCPHKPSGTTTGCPTMFSSLSANWIPRRGRLILRTFTATSSPGSSVAVECSGKTCPRRSVQFRGTRRPQALVEFVNLGLVPGTRFEMRVRSPGSIGAYMLAIVRRTHLDFSRACLEPDSRKPRPHCTGVPTSGPGPDDRDGDSVPDAFDLCPGTHGNGQRTGCPPLRAVSVFSSEPENGQVRLGRLQVSTALGARISVQCSRSTTCPRARTVVARRGVTPLPGYRGLLVPIGTKIEIRATKGDSIGAYGSWTAEKRGLELDLECIEPHGWRPRLNCLGFSKAERPPRAVPWLNPFPFVRFAGDPAGRSIRVRRIAVQQAPKGARVTVHCSGRGCPYRRRAGLRTPIRALPGFGGKTLGPGSRITVAVTQSGRVGLFVVFTTRAGGVNRREACIVPGRARPRVCPVRP